MDAVTVVMAALAAGAGAGVTDAAKAAVVDAYSGLKAMLAERFRGKPAAVAALTKYESDPPTWEAPLVKYVGEVGVDEQTLALAHQVLEAAGRPRASYTVNATTVQGLQQGDRNKQINKFGS